MNLSYTQEAARCRAQAGEFAGKPEQPFLLRLSEAFDELAARDVTTPIPNSRKPR